MYDFDEVVDLVEGLNTVKTLKNWASKIENETEVKFQRRQTKNKKGQSYSYKIFSAEQVKLFQKLAYLRKQQIPLKDSIEQVFLTDDEREKRERISISKQEFFEQKQEVKELIQLTKELLKENNGLKSENLMLKK